MRIKNRNKNRGMALGLVILTIGILTAILALSLRRASNTHELTRMETQTKHREMKAYARFSQIQTALLNEMSAWIQVNLNCQGLGANALKACVLNSIPTNVQLGSTDPGTVGASSIAGKIPQRTLHAFDASMGQSPDFSYTIQCVENCNTLQANTATDGSPAYPKSFLVRVMQKDESEGHSITIVSGTIEINRAKLSDFSTLVTNETSNEVDFGSGTQAKVGVFFNNSAAGQIVFKNPPTESLTFEKLVTNASKSNLSFATSFVDIDQSGHSAEAGPVTFKEGVVITQTAASNMQTSFSSVATGAVTSGKGAQTATAVIKIGNSNMGNCQNDVSQCQVTVEEWDGAEGTSNRIYGPTVLSGKTSFVTQATSSVIVRSADTSSAAAFYGNDHITIISATAPIHIKNSIEYAGTPSPTQGNIAFVTQGTIQAGQPGVVIDKDAKALSGGTLNDIVSGSNSVQPDTNTFTFQAAAVGLSGAALQLDPALTSIPQGSSSIPTLGTLTTDGPMWGSTHFATRVADNTNNIIAGFNKLDSTYSSAWSANPPPGFNAETSISHTSSVVGLSIKDQSLEEAVQSVGKTYLTGAASKTANFQVEPQ